MRLIIIILTIICFIIFAFIIIIISIIVVFIIIIVVIKECKIHRKIINTVTFDYFFFISFSPRHWLVRPKIVKPNSSTMESEHLKRLIIECLAEANPPPSYVWTNAAGGIETHGRFLSVQNVDDLDGSNYTYTCTATNILGFDKRSVLFKITRRFYHDMDF